MNTYTLLPAVILTCLTTMSVQANLISDDFEADTSANYTIVNEANAASGDGTPDSTSAFAFDYIAAGIPLAPNSTAGDRGGLRLAANETSADAGPADHITAFHNTSITAATYRLTVDIYMRVEQAGGTTEFAHVGVAGATTDFLSIFTPIVDNGHFMSITGEGGSSSDYRHSAPGNTAIPTGDGSYLDPANTTNSIGALYQSIFPAPPANFAGSPGNIWTTLTIDVTPTDVTYALDGTPIIRTETIENEGLIGLGYTDPFSSVGPHFIVYDNLSVESFDVIPEPASAMLLGVTGLAFLRRRRTNHS